MEHTDAGLDASTPDGGPDASTPDAGDAGAEDAGSDAGVDGGADGDGGVVDCYVPLPDGGGPCTAFCDPGFCIPISGQCEYYIPPDPDAGNPDGQYIQVAPDFTVGECQCCS